MGGFEYQPSSDDALRNLTWKASKVKFQPVIGITAAEYQSNSYNNIHLSLIFYDLEQSNYLKNIHYSYAVREVLQTYIIKAETFSDCKVRDVWIEKFQSLTKEDLPEKLDEDGKDWLDKAVAAFLDEKQQGLNGKSLIDLMPDSSMILSEKLTFKGK